MPKNRPQINYFRNFATKSARLLATPQSFLAAIGFLIAWLLSGFFFNFSDKWEMFVSTSTSIATFVMLFILETSQKRDAEAIQLKLDELLRAVRQARTSMIALEERSVEEIEVMREDLRGHAKTAQDQTGL